MQRRELLALLGVGVAGALTPLSATERFGIGALMHREGGGGETFTAPQAELVARIADLVIPRTDTPGALDVGVPAFVDGMATRWFDDAERRDLTTGLGQIDARAGAAGFVASPAAEQSALLTALDGATGRRDSAEGAFRTLKGLIVYGYFTSEQVQKDVLETRIIPGRFDGCVPIPG